MFIKKFISDSEGIFDFIGNASDDYVANYEKIAKDDLASSFTPSDVKSVRLNLIEFALGLYQQTHGKELRIIDIGSAWGYVLNNISAKEVVALDISRTYLRNTSDKFIRIRANAEEIPIKDDYFDAVICTDVFEHVQNAHKLSSEIQRITKPGGKLFLSVPWEQDLSVYTSEEYITKYKKYDYVHLRSVNEQMINDHFSGFEENSNTIITVGMEKMTIKPYPIKFYQFTKKDQ